VPHVSTQSTRRFRHYPKSFHKSHAAAGTAFVMFKNVPTSSLDEAWSALNAEKIAFEPTSKVGASSGAGRYGIFPLIHLPGNHGGFPPRVPDVSTRYEYPMAASFRSSISQGVTVR
jgi:hypothetical protein